MGRTTYKTIFIERELMLSDTAPIQEFDKKGNWKAERADPKIFVPPCRHHLCRKSAHPHRMRRKISFDVEQL